MKLQELIPSARSGGATVPWAVGVTTAPRLQPTLGVCLESLARAGWRDVHLFMDGTLRVPSEYSHLPTTWREHSIGAAPAWLLSLAELIALHPQALTYALFQDDAFLHFGESVKDYLEESLWPGEGRSIVSLYDPGLLKDRGWHRMPYACDWATHAVLLPAALARELISDSIVLRRAIPSVARQHLPIPELLSEWLLRRGVDVWYPSPSLVQHIGHTSTIWPHAQLDRRRRAPWFSADLEHPSSSNFALADFPESSFPCAPEHAQQYHHLIEVGRSRMSELSVVICGLCRDVRPYLNRTAARIERLGEMFGDYRVLLFENDSVDSTLEFLRDWQSINSKVEVLSESLAAPKWAGDRSLVRAAALAEFRNRYLTRLRQMDPLSSHVIVVDTDLVGGWSYEGIAHSFGHDEWDFIGSFGLQYAFVSSTSPPSQMHYDTWAYRAAQLPNGSKPRPVEQSSLRRGAPRLPVESCFGGLGIYRAECLRHCRYGGGDCEHVVLHRQMRGAGYSRLYLNPSQIVLRTAGAY